MYSVHSRLFCSIIHLLLFVLLSGGKKIKTKIQIKRCLFWYVMILIAGISGFIHVWISTVRVIRCIRNACIFSFASVTVSRSPLFLRSFGYHRWGRAATLWVLPAAVTYMAGKEPIDLALWQAGTLSPGILRAQASLPQAAGQPKRALWDVPRGAPWPAVILRIFSVVLQVGRLFHVAFHAVGHMHRRGRHWKVKIHPWEWQVSDTRLGLHTCMMFPVAAGRILLRITCAQHPTQGLEPWQGPTNTEDAFCFLCLLFWWFFGQLLWECIPTSSELISIPQDLFQVKSPLWSLS